MIYRKQANTIAQVHEGVSEAINFFTDQNNRYEKDYWGRTGIRIKLPRGAKTPILWFRGHERYDYKLRPNIQRKTSGILGPVQTYNQLLLRENVRSALVSARVTHLVDRDYLNSIDWQVLTEHYGSKTRLLDWSESLNVALTFALEPHISNPQDKRFSQRILEGVAPHIWVLNPVLLNMKVYEQIAADGDLVANALNDLDSITPAYVAKILEYLKKGINNYLLDSEYALSGIVSLYAIENMRINVGSRLKRLLERDEFNPFLYLAARIYIDRLKCGNYVPPIAILHPYHSTRIEKQRGTFSVFAMPPVDASGKTEETLAFEDFKNLRDCLFKIELGDVRHLASEMLHIGQTRAELYPELQTYAEELEWGAQ